ncbi:MAG: TonB family protein [Betaproteobacteria bacterium]|nr:TonB family protein [Betaproteobacteria bacterium]
MLPPNGARRLVVAIAASAMIHAWLITSVRVVPPRAGSSVPGFVMNVDLGRPDDSQPAPRRPSVRATDRLPAERGRKPVERRVAPLPSLEALPVPEAASPAAGAVVAVRPPDLPSRPSGPWQPERPSLALRPAPERDGPAVEVPQVSDPEFYPARALDVLPRPVGEITLHYPDAAATGGVSGTVTLLLKIDELGMVVDASVISADPPGYFEQAAIDSFRGTLFHPGRKNGRAVRSRLPVEVTFDAHTESMKQ